MNDNHITWNIRNWVTVFLMFATAWAILSLGVRFLRPSARADAVASDARENTLLAAGVA